MNKYFVNKDGEEKGGFSFEELKAMKIERGTMVWFSGLDKWVKAEHVEELKPLFEMMPPKLVSPPPFPSTKISEKIVPPPFTGIPNTQNYPAKPQSNNNKYWILGLLLLSLIGFGAWYFAKSQDTQTQITIDEQTTTPKTADKKQKQYKKVNKSELEGNLILTSNGGNVNIRKSPDISASVIYQLNKGEEVVYLGEKSQFMTSVMVNGVERNNFWFKVQAIENADAIGWVHGDFVNFPGNASIENKNRIYKKDDLMGMWWTPHAAMRKVTFFADDRFIFEDGSGKTYKGVYEFRNNTVNLLNDEYQVRLKMSGGGKSSFVLSGDSENFVKEWDDNHR